MCDPTVGAIQSNTRAEPERGRKEHAGSVVHVLVLPATSARGRLGSSEKHVPHLYPFTNSLQKDSRAGLRRAVTVGTAGPPPSPLPFDPFGLATVLVHLPRQ